MTGILFRLGSRTAALLFRAGGHRIERDLIEKFPDDLKAAAERQ